MPYYIYENWQAGPRKAMIHHGSCGHCKEGRGKAEGYDPNHAKWHGPFNALDEARAAQNSMQVIERKECSCVGKNE